MVRILVVDDDRSTRKLFSEILSAEGFEVLSAANGVEALECMEREQVHLAVVDVMMPEMDGLEFTRMLRQGNEDLPILMVSAKALSSDIKAGLRAGSDDYMTKPIDPEEMVLRVRALLRRFQISVEHKITLGDVSLDEDALTVTRGEEVVELPQKEFQLLYLLLSSPGRIFTRIQIMDAVWGEDSETGWETVTVHISRLRKRFADWDEFSIHSIRGLGYKATTNI
ncbi:MAG: response regulator transcription factor [Clostridia bacterium]|nr:response regulator transcription factor [Clostridia bacterium]